MAAIICRRVLFYTKSENNFFHRYLSHTQYLKISQGRDDDCIRREDDEKSDEKIVIIFPSPYPHVDVIFCVEMFALSYEYPTKYFQQKGW